MTYTTRWCPHCGHVISRTTNEHDKIGCPFTRCPKCGKNIITSACAEWVNKDPASRFLFYLPFTLMNLSFCFNLMVFFALMCNQPLIVTILLTTLSVAVSIFLLSLIYKDRKKGYRKEILESLERTKNQEYRQELLDAGFSFYAETPNLR